MSPKKDPHEFDDVLLALGRHWVLVAPGVEGSVDAESLQIDLLGLDAEPIKPFLDVTYVRPKILRRILSANDCGRLLSFMAENIERHAARAREFETGPAEWPDGETQSEAERIRIMFWMATVEWLKWASANGGAFVKVSKDKPTISDCVVHLRWSAAAGEP
jgi:hypothetical protein